ncbi:hypothetical protein TWF506_000922 [Arthrobotrys conoides]|uniref:DUF7928 domain-containing protein n=1 Tax=Arthrobotrys conoides TaxID=74498 RepID=A0AAN8NGG9_9PEZI
MATAPNLKAMEIFPAAPVPANVSSSNGSVHNHLCPNSIEGSETHRSLELQRSTENSQLIASHIYQRFNSSQWTNTGPKSVSSVCVRIRPYEYAIEPVPADTRVLEAVQKLDVKVAFLMRPKVTEFVFRTISEEDAELVFPKEGVQVQILESLDKIIDSAGKTVRKFQHVCFLRQERAVLLWHDNTRTIFKHAEQINIKMMSLLWGQDLTGRLHPSSAALEARSSRTSIYSLRSTSTSKLPWQVESSNVSVPEESKETTFENHDIEGTVSEPLDRPTIYTSSIYTGVAIFIMTALLFGGALCTLVVETAIDGQYIRLALAVTLPFSGSWALNTNVKLITGLRIA